MAIHPQLPNAITLARIPLAVLFFVLLLVGGPLGDPHVGVRIAAAVIFIVGISTDGVDGWLARRHNIVSDFGKLWDPIADKLLTGSAFLGLAILAEIPWWMVVVILVREWGVTVHRLIVRREHVVAAAWMGKAKTVVQAVMLSWALLPLHALIGLGPWALGTAVLLWAALILTVASGIDYVVAQARGTTSRS